MRYLKAKFINYIGFYNGMGLNEIEFDFSRSIHKVILISGKNGSGKSTLLNHLNPFPDGSSDFIPEKTAEKHLVLESSGDIYTISLMSPADLKGRKTTKAYIQKNGIELNQNGNVSSYKDIIFSEFDLDSNYISLSNLSSTDRGLGDKTPAERKKFVSNIIDNLEIYNSMYKTLNKKSLIYKSHIGTLHTKIQNIGDKSMLEQRLSTLKNKEIDLNNKILQANNEIVAIQAKNSIDESEALKIQQANDNCINSKKELDLINVDLDNYYYKTKIKKEDIESKLLNTSNLLSNYNNKLLELTTNWKAKCSRLSEVGNSILSLEAEINSAQLDDTVSDRFNQSKTTIESIKHNLAKYNISPDTSLIFEITNLISFCEKFVHMIDNFYDQITPSDVELIVNNNIRDVLQGYINEQNNILDQLSSTKDELSKLQSDMKILSILEQRPDKCKIDSCPFISDAIKLKKSIKNDPISQIALLNASIDKLQYTCTEMQEKIDYTNLLVPKSTNLDTIRALVLEFEGSIRKFYPDFIDSYNNMISNMNTFNIIREHINLTEGLNLLKLLEVEQQNYKILEVEYESFRDKIKLFNSSKSMMNNFKEEQTTLVKETTELKSDIDNYQSIVDELNPNLQIYTLYANKYKDYNNKNVEYLRYKSVVDEYNDKSNKAMESLTTINSLRSLIDTYNTELVPISHEISTISGELTLVDSYYEEYEEYNQSYKIIETLKKYCSPTGGGIQTLFMQLYMSKTKDLANSVLGMLFNGSYQLMDFVINDNEFRIPFIGEGLPVDDISSGSSAQVSMMSMIINLVLLHQGSSKFNIAMLDEINQSLDTYNNSIFVSTILRCIDILGIDQLFMISHSIDTDGSFADIIKLKGYDNYEFNISGNVIFDYNELISKQ